MPNASGGGAIPDQLPRANSIQKSSAFWFWSCPELEEEVAKTNPSETTPSMTKNTGQGATLSELRRLGKKNRRVQLEPHGEM